LLSHNDKKRLESKLNLEMQETENWINANKYIVNYEKTNPYYFI